MAAAELSFARVGPALSVRSFRVRERISETFEIEVVARTSDAAVDLGAVLGQALTLRLNPGWAHTHRGGARSWTGICRTAAQVEVEPSGLSTYSFVIVPALWLLGERRNYRIFQEASVPSIVTALLTEWGVTFEWRISAADYPVHEYRVQYGETDLAFLRRLIEEVGIVFSFAEDEGGTKLVLGDAFHRRAPREGGPIPVVDNPSRAAEREHVTSLRFVHELREEAHVATDYDWRRPGYELRASVGTAAAPQHKSALRERHAYRPGAFLAAGGGGFHRDEVGTFLSQRAHEAAQSGRRGLAFETNALDLIPGTVFILEGSTSPELNDGSPSLLSTGLDIIGSTGVEWRASGLAVIADEPYRSPHRQLQPKIRSVQTAIVVGPAGQEIYTDELGRARIQFLWDREGQSNEKSSCWVRVAEGWSGPGMGASTAPRIGQEVLIAFADGSPDHPFVVGRLFNQTQRTVYQLPESKTESGWRSQASPDAGGYNEIRFEDAARGELLSVQAERDARSLTKSNETITVGNDRSKNVAEDETETTLGHRVQATGGDRDERTAGGTVAHLLRERQKLVSGDQFERVEGNQVRYVGAARESNVEGNKRELVEGSSSSIVDGDRREQVDGTYSLEAATLRTEARSFGVDSGGELHLSASNVVVEAPDITLKGGGGFVRLDGSGVIISGTLIKINEGGAPGSVVPAKFEPLVDPLEPPPIQLLGGDEIEIVELIGDAKPSDREQVPFTGAHGVHKAIVSQPVLLKARLKSGKELAPGSVTWAIKAEDACGDYRQDRHTKTIVPAPSTFEPNCVRLHFIRGSYDGLSLEVAVATKAPLTPAAATASFKVFAPRVDGVAIRRGEIKITKGLPNRDKNLTMLHYGFTDESAQGEKRFERVGMQLTLSATAPSACAGKLVAMQLVRGGRYHTLASGASNYDGTEPAYDYWLDAYTADQWISSSLPVGAGAHTFRDSPSSQLGEDDRDLAKNDSRVAVDEAFMSYFMYQSERPGSIWVTIARIDWRWRAVVEKVGSAGKEAWQFSGVPVNDPIVLVTNPDAGKPTWRASSELPEWAKMIDVP